MKVIQAKHAKRGVTSYYTQSFNQNSNQSRIRISGRSGHSSHPSPLPLAQYYFSELHESLTHTQEDPQGTRNSKTLRRKLNFFLSKVLQKEYWRELAFLPLINQWLT